MRPPKKSDVLTWAEARAWLDYCEQRFLRSRADGNEKAMARNRRWMDIAYERLSDMEFGNLPTKPPEPKPMHGAFKVMLEAPDTIEHSTREGSVNEPTTGRRGDPEQATRKRGWRPREDGEPLPKSHEIDKPKTRSRMKKIYEIRGEKMSISQIAAMAGVSVAAIHHRLARGVIGDDLAEKPGKLPRQSAQNYVRSEPSPPTLFQARTKLRKAIALQEMWRKRYLSAVHRMEAANISAPFKLKADQAAASVVYWREVVRMAEEDIDRERNRVRDPRKLSEPLTEAEKAARKHLDREALAKGVSPIERSSDPLGMSALREGGIAKIDNERVARGRDREDRVKEAEKILETHKLRAHEAPPDVAHRRIVQAQAALNEARLRAGITPDRQMPTIEERAAMSPPPPNARLVNPPTLVIDDYHPEDDEP